jgi:hypothetical protein
MKTGVRLSFADVSEPSVRSIFKGWMKNMTEGPETSAKINLTPGKYPKEHIQNSEHGENLKSRILINTVLKVQWGLGLRT